MTRSRLTITLSLAAFPAVVLVGSALWFALSSAGDPPPRDRTSAVRPHAADDATRPRPTAGKGSAADAAIDAPGPRSGEGAFAVGGAVLTPSGEPAPGAEVRLVRCDPDEARLDALRDPADRDAVDAAARDFARRVAESPQLRVPPEGRYEFRGIDPGLYRLVARADGFQPAVSDLVRLAGETADESVDLTLAPAESLGGLVLAPGGEPLAGARVDARWSAESPPRDPSSVSRIEALEAAVSVRSGSSHTDAAGRFALADLRSGAYDLTINADGFARGRITGAPTGGVELRIVLRPELFLRGEVIDAAAEPIAGAEVRLRFLAADASDPDAMACAADDGPADPTTVHRAHTGQDGRFAIGGLARGTYRAEVDHPGHLRAIVPMVAVHEDSPEEERYLSFELEDGHRIRGVVRSEEGQPLEGARVRVRYSSPIDSELVVRAPGSDPVNRSILTDARGAFDFPSLPAGEYLVDVSARDHARHAVEDVPTGEEPLEIELAAARPIEGHVVDAHSGEPVSGARVGDLSGDRNGDGGTRTDAGGRFLLESLPGSAGVLRVEAEGYQTLDVTRLELDGAGPWTLELERSGSVSGRVRAGADPVEGLRVRLVREAVSLRAGTPSSTDEDGFYRLFVPEPGTYRVVVNGHPYVEARSEPLAMSGDARDVEDIDILLDIEATVRGVVLARDLGALGGARVRLLPARAPGEEPVPPSSEERGSTPEPAEPAEEMEARTDATGQFVVRGVREGSYRAVASAPGYIKTRSEVIELTPGSAQVVELELEPEMTITGYVFSAGVEPLTSSEVRATVVGESRREYWSEERTVVSTLGSFRLSRLADRLYDLRAAAPGFASALVESVRAGADGVVLRLERLVPLSGRVVGAFTGEPAEEYRLTLEFDGAERLSPAERQSVERVRKFQDPGGAFSIDGLPPGRYFVHVDAPRHLEADPVEVVLPPEDGLEDVVVPLTEVGVIAGVVLDSFSEPIAGARVDALERRVDPDTGRISYRPLWLSSRRARPGRGEREGGDRDPPGRARTKGDGGFAMRDLPDGLYRLDITHDEYIGRELGDYALENGSGGEPTENVRAFLAAGVVLHGRVRGLEEAQGGSVSVYLRPTESAANSRPRRGSGRKSSRVDESGLFEIRGLAPGEYELYARFRRARDGSSRSLRRVLRINDIEREKGVLLDLGR